MKTFEYTIKDPAGIHTRPAGQLAALTKTLPDTISISGKGKTVDGKRMISIMSLGIKQGDTITVSVEGADEEKSMTAVENFLKENL